MSLVEFKADRFFETAETLIFSLRYMAGDIDDFLSDDVPDEAVKVIERNLPHEEAIRKYGLTLPCSTVEWFEDKFNDQWLVYARSLKRLDAILNYGDVYLLDVDEASLQILEAFYGWLKTNRMETKPKFVSDGPQELRHCVLHILMGADLLSIMRAMFESPRKTAVTIEPLTPLQQAIMDALDGKGLKKEQLAEKVAGGDGSRLYKPGGIKELRGQMLVAHKDGVGYYRPDRPPV